MGEDLSTIMSQIQVLEEQGAGVQAANNAAANTLPALTAISTQKTQAFNAAYGDLQNNTNALHALYYYGLRNADLSGAQNIAIDTLQTSAKQLVHDQQLAKRQNEVNQWTASNKLDTLFVYQQLLIILCATIILLYLMKRGLLSTTVFLILVTVMVLIFIFTVVNRVQYTNRLRDGRFWNKRKFEQQQPVAINCDSAASLLAGGEDALANLTASLPTLDISGNIF
jgi:hypothetical protein